MKYKKGDLVAVISDFFYQVYLIQDTEPNYYHTAYFQQSRDGFKLRIHKSHIVEESLLDDPEKFQILDNPNSWKDWILEWCFRIYDYPGYLEFINRK